MPFSPWEYAEKNGTEYGHQVALFMWANMAVSFGLSAADDPASYKEQGKATLYKKYIEIGQCKDDRLPPLEWLHAIGNQGHGDKIRGAMKRAEGVKAGVPDMMLPVPMRLTLYNQDGSIASWLDCHGLYIELKRPQSEGKAKGSASDEQKRWRDYLNSVGYRCEIATGWLEAREIILRYLGVIA